MKRAEYFEDLEDEKPPEEAKYPELPSDGDELEMYTSPNIAWTSSPRAVWLTRWLSSSSPHFP